MRISDWSSDVCSSDLDPVSGFSCPVISRNKVVLPAPLGPIIPTIPAGGSIKFRFSNSNLSPYALETFSATITLSPRRGPEGMNSSSLSSFSLRSEEHTSELQSLMRLSYAVFCLKQKRQLLYRTSITYNEHY